MIELPSNSSAIQEIDELLCYMHNEDVFYTYFKPNSVNSAEQVKFVFDHYREITKGTTVKVLVEMGEYSSLDSEARAYLQSHKVAGACEAIVTKNLAQLMIINFYFRFKSHKHPSKAFKKRANALKWMNSF